MKIGELAARTGCEVETIRYYEREGLLPAPPRGAGNYRHYGEPDVVRLSFIRHCRSLGLPLADIRVLQDCQAGDRDCAEVDDLLARQLLQAEARLRELRTVQDRLQTLRGACVSQGIASHCGILQHLQRRGNTCICHP